MPRIAEVFVNSNTKYYYREYVTTQEDTTTDWDNNGYYTRAVNAMKNAGAKMNEITNKDTTFNFYDLEVKLMNTASASSDEKYAGVAVGENKNSIIQLITHKNGIKTVLSADMETEDEYRIRNSIGKVNVLKSGHHGYISSTGNDYINTLKPETIIISNYKVSVPANYCYAEQVNSKAKTYLTGNAFDAIVMTYTDDSYTIRDARGEMVPYENVCSKSIKSGWINENSCSYYYSYEKPLTGLQRLSSTKGSYLFYFQDNGCMYSGGTKTIDGESYTFGSDGICTSHK